MNPPEAAQPAQGNAEILALIETLLETERRLVELTGGEVDTVSGRDGRAFLLRRAQEQLRFVEAAKQTAILNALPAHIVLLDTEGVIISVNEAWRHFSDANELRSPAYLVGINYLEVCDQARGANSAEARAAAVGIRAVLSGAATSFSIEYPCHSPGEQRWFLMTATPLAGGSPTGAVVMHMNISERKRAETASVRLAAIVESSGDAIISKDLNSIITSWNRGAERVFGFHANEMVGTSILRLSPDDPNGEDPHILEKIKRGENVEHFDTQRKTKDGTVIDISVMASPIKDAAGTVIGVSIAARDITKYKRSIEALRQSEQRFSGAFEHAPIGMALISPEGQWLKVNSALCKSLGYTEAEFLSSTFLEITHSEDVDRSLENLRRALAAESGSFSIEKRYVHKQGHSVNAAHSISLIRDAKGLPLYFIIQIQDITERKQAEARLRRLIDSNAQGVIFFTTKGEIFEANDAALKLVGYTREDLKSGRLNWIALTPTEFAHLDRRALAELTAGGASAPYEKEYIHKNGSRVPILIGAALFEDGKDEGVCFIIDLTERKKAEAELEKTHIDLLETSRLAGMAEVATGVLHNVGNVLNSVNVASTCVADTLRKSKLADLNRVAALMREHAPNLAEFMTSNPQGKHLAAYVGQLAIHLNDEQAAVLQELAELQKNIEHIKAIVKLQQNFAKVLGVAEPLKITDLIEDALRMNAGGLIRHGIRVEKEFEDVPPITVEKHKLLQILVNLIRNAKDACSASTQAVKRLHLGVSRKGRGLVIEVSDNGVGISPENLTRVFSHGFTTKKEGHGFGLHSSVLAVKDLGGNLSVHSDGVGKGATFVLELPYKYTVTEVAK